MSIAIFERIIDRISDKPRVIGMTMMGEPMINKHIVRFVRTASANSMAWSSLKEFNGSATWLTGGEVNLSSRF